MRIGIDHVPSNSWALLNITEERHNLLQFSTQSIRLNGFSFLSIYPQSVCQNTAPDPVQLPIVPWLLNHRLLRINTPALLASLFTLCLFNRSLFFPRWWQLNPGQEIFTCLCSWGVLYLRFSLTSSALINLLFVISRMLSEVSTPSLKPFPQLLRCLSLLTMTPTWSA